MSTVKTDTLSNVAGTKQAPVGDMIDGRCTAWVTFDGTTTPPTIKDSFNVADVIRNATGIFEVVYLIAMDNANYAVSTEASYPVGNASSLIAQYDTKSIGSVTLSVKLHNDQSNETLTNPDDCSVSILGGKN